MDTEETKVTVGAGVAPVKKLRLSEVIGALENGEFELDCGSASLMAGAIAGRNNN